LFFCSLLSISFSSSFFLTNFLPSFLQSLIYFYIHLSLFLSFFFVRYFHALFLSCSIFAIKTKLKWSIRIFAPTLSFLNIILQFITSRTLWSHISVVG
jgi:hypothetical protein